MLITLDDLRRFAAARSFFAPTTLKRALHRLGFVQADPIRSPARAKDLMLRHRVKNYRAGDLERRYARLGLEEDFFVTHGFVTRSLQALMHPRSETGVPADSSHPWPAERRKKAKLLLEFVRERGPVHCRASRLDRLQKQCEDFYRAFRSIIRSSRRDKTHTSAPRPTAPGSYTRNPSEPHPME